MAWKKKHVMDRHIPTAFSITRRTKILFEEKCDLLGVGRSEMAEQLLLTFINE